MNHPNRKLAYTRYKLVTQDYTTNGGTKWRDDKGKWLTVTATGTGKRLCSPDVVHFYDHPVIAVIANKNHADIQNPRLLLIKCSKPVAHDGLKGGAKSAKAVKEISLPSLSPEQKVEFAIRVSFEVMTELKIDCPKWFAWALDWLSGKDRTAYAANAAANAAYAANAAKLFMKVLKAMKLDMKIKIQAIKKTERP